MELKVSPASDYDPIAIVYAQTRSARPWVLSALDSAFGSLPRSSVVLEVGCGTGNYCIELKARHPHLSVHAFDILEKMLRIAQLRASDASLVMGNADEAFPYQDKSADGVFCVDVIHHLREYARFFSEAHRVLNPNGRLLM